MNTILEEKNLIPHGDRNIELLIKDDRVNGVVVPKLEVSNTKYRYKIHNNSSDTNYNLVLSDKNSFKVVLMGDGFLNEPKKVNYVVLKSGDYVEVVIDFSRYSIGDMVMLASSAFDTTNTRIKRGMEGMHNDQNMDDIPNMNNDQSMHDTKEMNENQNMHNDQEMDENQHMDDMSSITNMSIMRFDIVMDESDSITLYTHLDKDIKKDKK